MLIQGKVVITTLGAALLAFAINMLTSSKMSAWLSLLLVLAAAFGLYVVVEVIVQKVVPRFQPSIDGHWIETVHGKEPTYGLCVVAYGSEPHLLSFHGTSYDVNGEQTGAWESTAAISIGGGRFIYEFTGTIYREDSPLRVQGLGSIVLSRSARGAWDKATGSFFHTAGAEYHCSVELIRLTSTRCRELIGAESPHRIGDEKRLVTAFHARRTEIGGTSAPTTCQVSYARGGKRNGDRDEG